MGFRLLQGLLWVLCHLRIEIWLFFFGLFKELSEQKNAGH